MQKLKRTFATQTEADKHYLQMAMEMRVHSDDPKARDVLDSGVGAVIVTASQTITSANVLPPRLKEAYLREQRNVSADNRYFIIEHAERAAIFKAYQAGADLSGATMYCTRFPCADCARAIAFSDIRRLVVPRGFKDEARWLNAQRAALAILRDSKVTVRYLGIDKLPNCTSVAPS